MKNRVLVPDMTPEPKIVAMNTKMFKRATKMFEQVNKVFERVRKMLAG